MNLTIEDQRLNYIKRHDNLKLQGVKYPLCEGYYRIKEIHDLSIRAKGISMLVVADWKPIGAIKTDPFYTLALRIDPLFYYDSQGFKEENPDSFIGKIIKVLKVEVYTQEWNRELRVSTKVKWLILHCKKTDKQVISLPAFENDLDQNDTFQKVTDMNQITDLLNSKPIFQ